MFKLKNFLPGLSIVGIVVFGAASASFAADEPNVVTKPPKALTDSQPSGTTSEEHIMMDHSPGDAKSMRTMKDKKIPIHRSGAADPVEGDSPPKK